MTDPADSRVTPAPEPSYAPFDYQNSLMLLGILVSSAAAMEVDADKLTGWIERLDTVAPLFAPSEWMRGGAKNLSDQRALIELTLPFIRKAREFVKEHKTESSHV